MDINTNTNKTQRVANISDSTIEEIKSRTNIVDLVSSYGLQIKSAGSSKKTCCPFHKEKTPSFNINERKGFYHCFGCGESGDVIKFVMKMDGLTFVEAAKKLADGCGVKIEEKEDQTAEKRRRLLALMLELAQFYHRCLFRIKEAEVARQYLKSRSLDETVQKEFLIGYAPLGIDPILKWAQKYGFTAEELEEAGVIKPPRDERDKGFHRFGGRLIFSVKDKQGRVVAFSGRQLIESKNSGKYVNSPETLIFKKSNILFGFDKAAGNIAKSSHHEAIVCEGQIDTIRLHISGFPIAVASQGTAFTDTHVALLKRVADQATLVFDDDEAGHKATIRTAGMFLSSEMPVRVISLPNGDDPDSYLRKHSASDFQNLFNKAESIVAFQIRTERSKESEPNSVDAISRVARAVITTISQSKNAVIRASMIDEAAHILGLPQTALQEELSKIRLTTTVSRRDDQSWKLSQSETTTTKSAPLTISSVQIAQNPQNCKPLTGADARTVIPPPPMELALCEFLMANEYDKSIKDLITEYLPNCIFHSDFIKRFITVWCKETESTYDEITPFISTLTDVEFIWFKDIVSTSVRVKLEDFTPSVIVPAFIRNLWVAAMKRKVDSLSNSEIDEEIRTYRVKLLREMNDLMMADWDKTKSIILSFIRKSKDKIKRSCNK